jgi:hypothetical protein
VLEFDQFMKIEGCKTKDRHLFVGSGKKEKESSTGEEEVLETVRYVENTLPAWDPLSSFALRVGESDCDRAIPLGG